MIAPFEPSVSTLGSIPRLGQELLAERACSRAGLAEEPGPRGQLLDRDPAAPGQRVAGGGHDHELVVREVHPHEPVVVRDAAGDRHVHVVVEHPLEDQLAVPHVQADLEVGPALAERLDQLRHQVLARGRDRADPQRVRPRLLRLTRHAGPLREQAEHVARIGRVRGARGCRTHGAPEPLGQLNAQLPLERRHRSGHRRLRDHQLLRGSGNRPAPHDGEEGNELRKRHRHA